MNVRTKKRPAPNETLVSVWNVNPVSVSGQISVRIGVMIVAASPAVAMARYDKHNELSRLASSLIKDDAQSSSGDRTGRCVIQMKTEARSLDACYRGD